MKFFLCISIWLNLSYIAVADPLSIEELLSEAGKLPTDAQKAAHIIYEEISKARERVSTLLPVDSSVETSREFVFSLLNDPNSEKASRLLDLIDGQSFYFQFLRSLKIELKKDPAALVRIEKAIEQLELHIKKSTPSLPIPFQRSLPLGLVILSLDDAFHSIFSTFDAYGFEAHYYLAAGTTFFVAIVKDLLFKAKSFPSIMSEWKNARRKKSLITDIASLVKHYNKHKAAMHNVRGLKFTIEDSKTEIPAILHNVLGLYSSEKEAAKGSLAKTLQSILREKRLVNLIKKMALNQSPQEIKQINAILKGSALPLSFEQSEGSLSMQRELELSLAQWLATNPAAKKSDLVSELASAQATSRTLLRSNMSLSRLNEVSLLVVGIAAQLAGHVASVGLAATPVDNPISETIRTGGVGMLYASQAVLIAGLSFITLNMATGWTPFGSPSPKKSDLRRLPDSFYTLMQSILRNTPDKKLATAAPRTDAKLQVNAAGYVDYLRERFGFGYYETKAPKAHYREFTSIYKHLKNWFSSSCNALSLAKPK